MSNIERHNRLPYSARTEAVVRNPTTSNPERVPDLRDLVRRLAKRKRLIALIAALVIVPATIATLLTKPFYSSSALIQVNPDPVQVLPYRDIADSGAGVYYEVYMSTQDQILKGPNLLARVAARLESEKGDLALFAEAPFLGQRFQVARVPNSQLFRISYSAPLPETAARVVNIFAEEYVKQHLESRQATREKARESLQTELEGLEKRLQSSERGLVSYARSQDITRVESGQGDLVQARLSALDQQAAAAENEVILAQNRLDMKRKASLANFPETLSTPVISNLTSRVLAAEQELANLRASFGENWPAVASKRGEIGLLKDQLTREKQAVIAQSVEQAQLELVSAQSRLKSNSNALAQQKDTLNRYNNALIEYNILRREAEANRKLYDGLLERLRQASLEKGFEFGNLQIVDPGRPNYSGQTTRLWYNLALAILLGLTLGVGAALLLDFWDNSVSTLEGIEEFTQLPGLGAIPSSKFLASGNTPALVPAPKSGQRVQALELSAPGSVAPSAAPPPEVSEAVRAICASILLSQSDIPLRTIAVTSAIPGEGKTTFVAQVGRALAESGARTLLVEADLRRPFLAESFDIQGRDGLSLFLSGHAAVPRICETDQPNLFVAPAGPRPPNPMALLGSEKMNLFLKHATNSFRFVLIDTPPILAVADARVLGAKADGMILVVRAHGTTKKLILRARSMLQNSGINLLGTVLNRVAADDLSSNYYRAYYASA